MKRLITALLLAVVTSGVILFGGMSHAAAAPLCATPPTPAPPKTGLSGLFTRPPAKPVTGDPFADPKIAIHDVYGTSWNLTMYDLGCIPDATGGDAIARFDNANATLVMDAGALTVSFLGLLESLAKESSIDWLSAWIGAMSETITPIVLGGPGTGGGLLPIALIITAIWMAWVAKSGRLSQVGHQLAVVGVAFILATWALAAPAYASKMADTAVTTAAAAGGSAFNASLTDGVNRQAMYRAWLAIHFGDADSNTAKTYGPKLAEATHYTWTEWAEGQADPNRLEDIKKQKQDRFKEVAADIKKADPGAYESLTGAGGSRSGAAFYAAGVSGLMSLFAVLAMIIIIVSRFMMQALVIVAPIGAILGVLPNGAKSLRDMWSMFLASLWNVFKFSLGAGLMAVLMGQLMTLDPVSAVVWMLAATVAFFVVLKPFRSFKTMMPGLDPNRSYTRDAFKFIGKTVVGAAAGGAAGAVAGAATAETVTNNNTTTRVESRTPPAPVFAQLPDRRVPVQINTVDRVPVGAGAPRPDGVALPGPRVPDSPALPGPVEGKRPARPVVVQAPDRLPVVVQAPDRLSARPGLPSAPAAQPAATLAPLTPLEAQPAAVTTANRPELPAAPPASAPVTVKVDQNVTNNHATNTQSPRHVDASNVVLEGPVVAGPGVYVPGRSTEPTVTGPPRKTVVYQPNRERTTA